MKNVSYESVPSYVSDGEYVDKVVFDLPVKQVELINKAVGVLNENPFIKEVVLNPQTVIAQHFYEDEIAEWRYDVEELIVNQNGSVKYRSYNKWDSSAYIEAFINLQ